MKFADLNWFAEVMVQILILESKVQNIGQKFISAWY